MIAKLHNMYGNIQARTGSKQQGSNRVGEGCYISTCQLGIIHLPVNITDLGITLPQN